MKVYIVGQTVPGNSWCIHKVFVTRQFAEDYLDDKAPALGYFLYGAFDLTGDES
jgi:hypothetical protein